MTYPKDIKIAAPEQFALLNDPDFLNQAITGQVLYLVEIIEAGVFNPQQLRLASLYRVSSACAVRA